MPWPHGYPPECFPCRHSCFFYAHLCNLTFQKRIQEINALSVPPVYGFHFIVHQGRYIKPRCFLCSIVQKAIAQLQDKPGFSIRYLLHKGQNRFPLGCKLIYTALDILLKCFYGGFGGRPQIQAKRGNWAILAQFQLSDQTIGFCHLIQHDFSLC